MVAEPVATPVTVPVVLLVPDTVAIALLLVAQVDDDAGVPEPVNSVCWLT